MKIIYIYLSLHINKRLIFVAVVVVSGIAGGAIVLSVVAIVIGVVYINKYK